MGEDFNYLCHVSMGNDIKYKRMFKFPLNNLARKGLNMHVTHVGCLVGCYGSKHTGFVVMPGSQNSIIY